jgi:magnesium chelatase accessory protein
MILLLHGAGSSTHTWRDLIPQFAASHRVVAIDLPGQGFTRAGNRQRFGLDPMAEDIEALCNVSDWAPGTIIAHSAGAAVALRLAQRLAIHSGEWPKIIGVNPALGEFEGLAGRLYPLFAKILAGIPLTSLVFSASRNRVAKARSLIEGTGSHLSEEGLSYYARLIGDRDHVDATLQMMAQWSLTSLLQDLADIESECLFIIGTKDRAVPPGDIVRTAKRMRNARVIDLPGLGHLAHEEAPEVVTRLSLGFIGR